MARKSVKKPSMSALVSAIPPMVPPPPASLSKRGTQVKDSPMGTDMDEIVNADLEFDVPTVLIRRRMKEEEWPRQAVDYEMRRTLLGALDERLRFVSSLDLVEVLADVAHMMDPDIHTEEVEWARVPKTCLNHLPMAQAKTAEKWAACWEILGVKDDPQSVEPEAKRVRSRTKKGKC